MPMASDIVKAGTESEFADFVIHWNKELKKQEASTVAMAAEKLIPAFNEARQFIHSGDEKKARVWVRIGYPYINPFLDFEIWYDESDKAYGIHVFEHLTWDCYGSIHFRHQRYWI